MKSKAAILWETNSKWSIEDIELDPPKQGEVLVKLAASGLCHSDEHLVTGDMVLDQATADALGLKQLPVVGGHEGAGEVVEVGPGVTTLAPGDHVVMSFIPACGRCPSCAMGQQHLCDLGAFLLAGRQVTDFTARHHAADGTDLGIMCCVGTFEPYTVVSEASCVKIEPHIPLERAALVGCGVTTGWGSAINAADVRAGETVVVVGLGGIGMNALQGARLAGADKIVAVDPLQSKRDAAPRFGATHTAASMEEAAALVAELTRGAMADKAILTVGVAYGDLILPLMNLVKKAGRGVVTAVAPVAQTDVKLDLFMLAMMRKELVGCIFGNANPRRDIPRILNLYMEGKYLLDELVTNTYSLEDINQGYDDMRNGTNIRGVITY
ncbi:MAG TPA: NDMA-dependent alcohol dehydrogenase [Acidimicrobiales bacterium]|nr:NDMA-dependent alcohol dehydrogenase [Acidimicrobiales bacterium]